HRTSIAARTSRSAIGFNQERRIFGVREQLDFAHTLADLPVTASLPQRCDRLVDQRRRNGALLDRQQLVGTKAVVAKRKLRCSLHLQSSAIPVVPFRRGVDLKFAGQFKLGRSAQRFCQNRGLDLQLMLVVRVLVMACATTLVVRASSLNAIGGGPNQGYKFVAREASLVLDDP